MLSEEDTRIKIYLNYLLRHGAKKMHLEVASDGFVALNSILEHEHTKKLYNLNIDAIEKLNNIIKCYELKEEDGEIFIRALHGHSIKDILDYEKIFKREITDADELPRVFYQTYPERSEKIKEEGIELEKNQNFIHFSTQVANFANRTVLIEVDMKMAMADGMKFYECFNGVIATPGIDGVVAPKYFKFVLEDVKEMTSYPARSLFRFKS